MIKKLRHFCISIIIVFGGVFILSQAITFTSDLSDPLALCLVDYEDSTESSQDQQGEKQVKEYRLVQSSISLLSKLHLSSTSEFGQVSDSNALEVFLEVVTPPPELYAS